MSMVRKIAFHAYINHRNSFFLGWSSGIIIPFLGGQISVGIYRYYFMHILIENIVLKVTKLVKSPNRKPNWDQKCVKLQKKPVVRQRARRMTRVKRLCDGKL
jgi:hypothetical protein